MKYLVKKDIKIRNKQKLLELKNFCLKFFSSQKFNHKTLCKYSKSKVMRRRIFTGRGRGSTRFIGNISRSPLKDLLSMRLIPGYKKGCLVAFIYSL